MIVEIITFYLYISHIRLIETAFCTVYLSCRNYLNTKVSPINRNTFNLHIDQY